LMVDLVLTVEYNPLNLYFTIQKCFAFG